MVYRALTLNRTNSIEINDEIHIDQGSQSAIHDDFLSAINSGLSEREKIMLAQIVKTYETSEEIETVRLLDFPPDSRVNKALLALPLFKFLTMFKTSLETEPAENSKIRVSGETYISAAVYMTKCIVEDDTFLYEHGELAMAYFIRKTGLILGHDSASLPPELTQEEFIAFNIMIYGQKTFREDEEKINQTVHGVPRVNKNTKIAISAAKGAILGFTLSFVVCSILAAVLSTGGGALIPLGVIILTMLALEAAEITNLRVAAKGYVSAKKQKHEHSVRERKPHFQLRDNEGSKLHKVIADVTSFFSFSRFQAKSQKKPANNLSQVVPTSSSIVMR